MQTREPYILNDCSMSQNSLEIMIWSKMKRGNMLFYMFLLINLSYGTLSIGSLINKIGLKSNPDVMCIIEHCMSQYYKCASDANCRDNLLCIASCGASNQTCLYECVNTYEDDTFDAVMKCMAEDYHCLKLISPDPTFRCAKPKQILLNFNLSQFEGPWYIALGLNRQYDCFDCQLAIYEPTPDSKNYTLTGHYDVTTINGSIRHRVNVQQLEQKDAQFGGLIDYTNNVMGLTMYEKWQVIDYAADGQYMIVYYCGNLTADWWYEGSLVYTRQPVLEPQYITNVTRALESMGRTIDQYCHKDNTGCGPTKTGGDVYLRRDGVF